MLCAEWERGTRKNLFCKFCPARGIVTPYKARKEGCGMNRNTKNMAKGAALGVMAGTAVGHWRVCRPEKPEGMEKDNEKGRAHSRKSAGQRGQNAAKLLKNAKGPAAACTRKGQAAAGPVFFCKVCGSAYTTRTRTTSGSWAMPRAICSSAGPERSSMV